MTIYLSITTDRDFFHTAGSMQCHETNKILQICARLLVHIGRFVPHCRALIVQTGVIYTMLSALDNYKSHSEPSQVSLVTCVYIYLYSGSNK